MAAAIVQRAIGDRLTCVYVDHGMMRLGETEQVRHDFEAVFDTLDVVDASEQFLGALEGIHDPEEKRKIIGREFIRVFEAAEARAFKDVYSAAPPPARRRTSSRARSTPTSSRAAAGPVRRPSSPTTTSAACPTT